MAEVIKLTVSLAFTLHDQARAHPSASILKHLSSVCKAVFAGDSWKLTIPAVLYTLQSSLLYTAISNLDVVTFQVNYQLKILTTAVFSVQFLGRQLAASRWLALVLLAFGIAIVQVPEPNELLRILHWEIPAKLFARVDEAQNNDAGIPVMNTSKGFAAVVAASVISGLTGVYFEKVVKDSAASVSIWTRNMQLSFYSIFPALLFGVLYKDGQIVREHGFFVGYNLLVWITVLLQVLGGLTVAMCVAQMDNIIKNFAVSISIVLSFLIEVYFFEASITINVSVSLPCTVPLLTYSSLCLVLRQSS